MSEYTQEMESGDINALRLSTASPGTPARSARPEPRRAAESGDTYYFLENRGK